MQAHSFSNRVTYWLIVIILDKTGQNKKQSVIMLKHILNGGGNVDVFHNKKRLKNGNHNMKYNCLESFHQIPN